MLIEIVFAREQLLAEVAVEHLLAGVRDDVPHQMLLAAERLVAAGLVALERPQAEVQLDVLRQVLFALEHLLAHGTCGHILSWICLRSSGGNRIAGAGAGAVSGVRRSGRSGVSASRRGGRLSR